MFLFVFESTRRNEGAKASGLTSMPNHVMTLSPLHDYMHDRTRFEPLYGHMRTSFWSHVFHQIVGFSTKSSHMKNCLLCTVTNELERQRPRKLEDKKKQSKTTENSERARLTLSVLMGMATQSSL